jgi:transcriptional regulator with GAF, ATPase, and Fis domain
LATRERADALLHPLAGDLAVELLEALAAETDPKGFASQLLARLMNATGCRTTGILKQQGANWKPLVWFGDKPPPGERIVALAADQANLLSVDGWLAFFLRDWPGGAAVLVASNDANAITPIEPAMRSIRALIGLALQADRSRAMRTCKRLREMLTIAAGWRSAKDTESLLRQIAVTAAKLLDADRASIFLHDSRRGVLIGRPALGVEGGQLEVPANAGIVGAVMQSGQPRRWISTDPKDEVNRTVDSRLRYQTRSLAAVPMRDGAKTIGVFEVINRHGDLPFDEDDEQALELLASHAAAALSSRQEHEKLVDSRQRVTEQAAATAEIVGVHPAMQTLRKSIAKVAATDLAVLLLGDNGTGKEVAARAIHFGSSRRSEPFIAVNCAALVETLLESELFGHEKGAFTDAVAARPGKFELAHGGTLFLDEIGDLSPSGQSKLLRALEEKVIVRVGGSTPIVTDVRVIAATNQPLAKWVGTGRFREDLFYRLNVVTLRLPPLRERGEDILSLAQYFLEQFCRRAGRPVPDLGTPAKRKLLEHSWPGNVRELRNLMERIAYLSAGDEVTSDDIELIARPTSPDETFAFSGKSLADATHDFQVRYIQAAIERFGGQMTEVAEQLGLHRPNLYRKMKQLKMDPPAQ